MKSSYNPPQNKVVRPNERLPFSSMGNGSSYKPQNNGDKAAYYSLGQSNNGGYSSSGFGRKNINNIAAAAVLENSGNPTSDEAKFGEPEPQFSHLRQPEGSIGGESNPNLQKMHR
eukprot:UN01816